MTTPLPDLGGFGGVEEIEESAVDEDYESFEYEDPGNEKDADCKEGYEIKSFFAKVYN